MAEQAPELSQGIEQGDNQGSPVADQSGQQQSGTINPAWNDLLSVVPSQLHSQVTPHLQKWDQNYQQSIQKVHSQYEPYDPFIQAGVSPEDMNFALGLMNAISNSPQDVLSALQEWVQGDQGGQSGQQGQFESNPQQPEFDAFQDPRVQELQSAVQTMAQILLSQNNEAQQSQADQELDDELKQLHGTHGDFDERYVLSLAMNDPEMSLEDAVKEFQNLQQSILSGKRMPGPPVLGSGGAIPNSTPDVRKLGSSDTKSLVANLLAQAQQQGN